MNAISAGQVYRIEQRFERALKTIRHALAKVGLGVAGEFDVAPASRVLLVDCPLLAFEALALDRAAAVFLPLHLLVSADDGRTQIVVIHPADLFDIRLPPGAAEPIERLQDRIAQALELTHPHSRNR